GARRSTTDQLAHRVATGTARAAPRCLARPGSVRARASERELREVRAEFRRLAKRAAIGTDRVVGPPLRRLGFNTKGLYEYAYWRSRLSEEKEFGNAFYGRMFTRSVGLSSAFYADKRVLDVGCGP